MLTLTFSLSQIRFTNVVSVLFFEQPRLRNAERQHNRFGIPQLSWFRPNVDTFTLLVPISFSIV